MFPDTASQLSEFRMYYDDGGSETLLYNNVGIEYGSGVFTIIVDPTITSNSIIIRRDDTLLTLCEVEVYGGKPIRINCIC